MPLVLIIDDAKDNVSLVRTVLETNGYEVLTAFDAVEGIARLRTNSPDVIVLDLRLPGSTMDGWEFIHQVRQDATFRNIPIIVTSVEVMPEDRTRALEAGCNAFLAKPFKISELCQVVDAHLRN